MARSSSYTWGAEDADCDERTTKKHFVHFTDLTYKDGGDSGAGEGYFQHVLIKLMSY